MEEFYKELLERQKYLESQEQNVHQIRSQLYELTLCIVRVQQILLGRNLKGEHLRQYAEEQWEGCDGCDEHDKYFWVNGFMSGYNNNK